MECTELTSSVNQTPGKQMSQEDSSRLLRSRNKPNPINTTETTNTREASPGLEPLLVVCRICTDRSPPDAASNLFECRAADGYSLAEVVALVGDVSVRPDEEGLPAWCCFQCQLDVEMAYRVRVLCQESDRKLREMLLEAAEVQMEPVEGPEPFAVDPVWKMEVEEPTLGSLEGEQQIDYNEEVEFGEESSWSQLENQTYPYAFEEIPNSKKRCCGCDQLFDSAEEILEHSKREHAVINPPKATKDREVCDICHRLMDRRYLELHKETPNTLFRCTTCGDLFFTQKKASRHYVTEHVATTTCCGCKLRFDTAQALRLHSDQVHLPHRVQTEKENTNECNICYQTFTSESGLYIHRCQQLSTEEETHKFKCSKCPKLLATQEALQFHEYGHRNPFSWKCSRCHMVFTDYNAYRTHLGTHRTPKELSCYRCEKCGKGFKFQILLREHKTKCCGSKKHQCNHCTASYVRKTDLKRHLKKFHPDMQASSTTEVESNHSEKDADDDLVYKLEVGESKASES